MNTEPPDPWQDTYNDVRYSAGSYDWVVVTIETGLDSKLAETHEIDARGRRPGNVPSIIATDVNALLDLGVNYIDIGFNTDRLAAEVPFANINVDRELAEKIMDHLLNIKTALSK